MNLLEHMGKAAKQASWQLAMLSTAKKNQALAVIAKPIRIREPNYFAGQ